MKTKSRYKIPILKQLLFFLITFHLAMPNTALIYYCGGFLKTQKEENYNFDRAHF